MTEHTVLFCSLMIVVWTAEGGRGGGLIPKQRKVNLNKGACLKTKTETKKNTAGE